MARKVSERYKNTQVYRLGEMYKELGEMLMGERTDLRDMVAMTHALGLNLTISFGEPEAQPAPNSGEVVL